MEMVAGRSNFDCLLRFLPGVPAAQEAEFFEVRFDGVLELVGMSKMAATARQSSVQTSRHGDFLV